jgi:glycosyltransferase involved in cell wall biosynthesis
LRVSTTNTAVLEALACGVPVVTTQGGIADYLTPSCGVLAPPSDPQFMAREAREQALRFAWPRVARQMAALYDRPAAAARSRAPGGGDDRPGAR